VVYVTSSRNSLQQKLKRNLATIEIILAGEMQGKMFPTAIMSSGWNTDDVARDIAMMSSGTD